MSSPTAARATGSPIPNSSRTRASFGPSVPGSSRRRQPILRQAQDEAKEKGLTLSLVPRLKPGKGEAPRAPINPPYGSPLKIGLWPTGAGQISPSVGRTDGGIDVFGKLYVSA